MLARAALRSFASRPAAFAADGSRVVVWKENNAQKFAEAMKASPKLVVVDFTAVWCPPCKMIAPVFEKLSTQHSDALFVKVDVDENAEISDHARISSVPTFQFYKQGEKVHEFSGASQQQLEATIAKYK